MKTEIFLVLQLSTEASRFKIQNTFEFAMNHSWLMIHVFLKNILEITFWQIYSFLRLKGDYFYSICVLALHNKLLLFSKVIKVGVLKRWIMISFCQEMAFVAAISQVKDCYKILKHIILPMYTN